MRAAASTTKTTTTTTTTITTTTTTTTNMEADSLISITPKKIFCGSINIRDAWKHVITQQS
jgi:predicted transglutaminase-like protease